MRIVWESKLPAHQKLTIFFCSVMYLLEKITIRFTQLSFQLCSKLGHKYRRRLFLIFMARMMDLGFICQKTVCRVKSSISGVETSLILLTCLLILLGLNNFNNKRSTIEFLKQFNQTYSSKSLSAI